MESCDNVFVYGTLLSSGHNFPVMRTAYMGAEPQYSKATLSESAGYRLHMWDPCASFPFACLSDKGYPGCTIIGELFIGVPDMRPLDALEGYPDFYDRHIVTVECLGELVRAWMYCIPDEDPRLSTPVPYGDWAWHIRNQEMRGMAYA